MKKQLAIFAVDNIRSTLFTEYGAGGLGRTSTRAQVRPVALELEAACPWEPFLRPPLPSGGTSAAETLARIAGWADALERLEQEDAITSATRDANTSAGAAVAEERALVDEFQKRAREDIARGSSPGDPPAELIERIMRARATALLWTRDRDPSALHGGWFRRETIDRAQVVIDALIARDSQRLVLLAAFHVAVKTYRQDLNKRTEGASPGHEPHEFRRFFNLVKGWAHEPSKAPQLDGGLDPRVPHLAVVVLETFHTADSPREAAAAELEAAIAAGAAR